MKPCRKQNTPARRQPASGSSGPGVPAVTAALDTPVHRYAHPIRIARPAQRSTTEELLSYILETLSRHSAVSNHPGSSFCTGVRWTWGKPASSATAILWLVMPI